LDSEPSTNQLDLIGSQQQDVRDQKEMRNVSIFWI